MNTVDLPTTAHYQSDPASAATHAVILRYHQAWKSRDLDAVLALYHPDLVYHDFLQNRRIERTQLRAYLASSLPVSAEELQEYTDRLRIDGDTAILQYRVTLKGSDGLVSFSAIEALTVRDGLIAQVNEYAVLVNSAPMPPQDRPGAATISRLGLSARQLGTLAKDLQHYFDSRQAYLDPALDLAQVAASTGYTRNQISFFLNPVRGQTFYAFLNQLRLGEVLTRLHGETNAARIDEIARAAGFNSLSTFYRCFKQHTGHSPRTYLLQRQAQYAPDSQRTR